MSTDSAAASSTSAIAFRSDAGTSAPGGNRRWPTVRGHSDRRRPAVPPQRGGPQVDASFTPLRTASPKRAASAIAIQMDSASACLNVFIREPPGRRAT